MPVINLCFDFRYGRPQDSCHQDTFLDMNKKIRTVQEQMENFRENVDTVKSLQSEIQFLNVALQVTMFLRSVHLCNFFCFAVMTSICQIILSRILQQYRSEN